MERFKFCMSNLSVSEVQMHNEYISTNIPSEGCHYYEKSHG